MQDLQIEAIQTSHPQYGFVENLLNQAFPRQERRDDQRQRELADSNPHFFPHLISESGKAIGLLTLWRLPGFTFAEHLAVDPGLRNGGYGARIMQWLKENEKKLILETELPETDLSRRRVAFYERCGFRICPKPYEQPAYHADEQPLPLHLMYYGWDSLDKDFESIRDTIYRYVYGK